MCVRTAWALCVLSSLVLAGCGYAARPIQGHRSLVTALAFSPDGTRLAVAARDGGVRLLDAESRSETVSLAPAGAVQGWAFSPDGVLLAGVGPHGATLWDTASGQVVRTLTRPDVSTLQELRSVLFTRDGAMVIAAGGRTLGVWDAASGTEYPSPLPMAQGIFCLALSPDGTRLAIGGGGFSGLSSTDGSITLVDTTNWSEVRTWSAHPHPGGHTTSLAFSPDGTRLASGCADIDALHEDSDQQHGTSARVKLWDVATGNEVATLDAGLKQYLGLAFSADGATLVAAGGNPFVTMKNGKVVTFDLGSLSLSGTLAETRYQVQCLALAPEVGRIAWASGDIMDKPGEPSDVQLSKLP
jgi:WD40 repeat protein